MKKTISVILTLLLLSMCFVCTGCNICRHTKGELVSICTKKSNDGKNYGMFRCTSCGEEYKAELTAEDVGMPILTLTGSFLGISKTNKITLQANYDDGKQNVDCYATLKFQGASSLSYAKKNYNIQFFTDKTLDKKNKIKVCDSWGKESKYCLKANFIDASQARNVVSGQIYSQILHSRNADDEVSKLDNGGVVDGFPILIFRNGEFGGIYTLNIPKDKWMFDMDEDEEKREAMLIAEGWSDSNLFKDTIKDLEAETWDLEFCSTSDVSWVTESFNELISFVRNNSGEAFINGIREYLDVDKTIDTMIYTTAIAAKDNWGKNIMWATYDGKKWFPSMYDMDGSWGLNWTGQKYYPSDETFAHYMNNVLWKKIYTEMYGEIAERYNELRGSVLSLENIEKTFAAFFEKIPDQAWEAECEKWQTVPNRDTNNFEQIMSFAKARLEFLDEDLNSVQKPLENPII